MGRGVIHNLLAKYINPGTANLAAVSTQTGLFTDAYSLVPSALPDLPLEEEALVDTASGPYNAF